MVYFLRKNGIYRLIKLERAKVIRLPNTIWKMLGKGNLRCNEKYESKSFLPSMIRSALYLPNAAAHGNPVAPVT